MPLSMHSPTYKAVERWYGKPQKKKKKKMTHLKLLIRAFPIELAFRRY